MKMTTVLMAAAVVSAGALLPAAGGEDVLDQVLGPKAGPTDVKKTEGAAEEAKPKEAKKEEATTPVGGELVSPEASKAVDDEDLGRKLTGETKPTDSPAGKFKEVIGRMDQSETLLKEKNTGNVTQETQRRIVMDLETLIEIAKKMQQQSSSSSSQSQKAGQQKQESKGNQQTKGNQSQGGTTAATNSVLPNGAASGAESNGADIHEKSREWGDLPPRDRDLISTGANEQYLQAYRDQIQKYYEALAEIGKAAKER